MTTQAVETLRAELLLARSVLLPQFQGLTDLLNIENVFSVETRSILRREWRDHGRRLHRINEVLDALDSLDADGYPVMPPTTVSQTVMDELKAQQDAIAAALAEFNSAAFTVTITPGEPVDK